MLLCFSLLLIYLVPFFLFVRYTRMRAGVPRWLVVLAVLGLAGRREGRDWLMGGMCVGMGFQLFEAFFCLIVAVPFLYTWGDITFDGGRRLSAAQAARGPRHAQLARRPRGRRAGREGRRLGAAAPTGPVAGTGVGRFCHAR